MRWRGVIWVCICLTATQFLPCSSQGHWYTNVRLVRKEESALVVEFAPSSQYDFHRYRLELWFLAEASSENQNATSNRHLCNGRSGNPSHYFDVDAVWPLVRQKFENIGTAGYYCIRVAPLTLEKGESCRNGCRWVTSCPNGCRWVSSDVFFVQGNNNTGVAHDCSNWNAVILLESRSPEHSVVVFYQVLRNASECWPAFKVDLWHEVIDRCDGLTGDIVNSTISYRSRNRLTFSSLPPGNYCIRIAPVDRLCSGHCLPRFSNVETLYALPSESLPRVPLVPSTAEKTEGAVERSKAWLYPTVLCAVLVGFSAFVFAVCLRRWRRRNKTKARVCNLLELAEQKPKTNCNVPCSGEEVDDVVVLYCHDSKLEEEGAKLLAQFLLDCCGLRVCTAMGDLHLIVISPEAWVMQKLSNGKIVIVESDGAVSRENPMLNRQCSSDGLLDKVFENSLAFLRSRNSLIDYQRIFVVRFSECPSDGGRTLQFAVPNERYVLPRHLPDLYARLVDGRSSRDLSLERWKSQPSYLRLGEFCQRANKVDPNSTDSRPKSLAQDKPFSV